MGNTIRKDRNGKTYKESLKKKHGRTRCRCEYCMDVEQNKLINKIAEKELKTELEERLDSDNPIQEEVLIQIIGRE